MLNLISCELLKLKRSKMVLISVAGVLSTPLLMLIEALQTHFDKPEIIFTLSDIYSDSVLYIMLLVNIMIYVAIAAYLFSREYTESTLKTILPIPISRTKLLIGKFCTLLLWIVMLTLVTWAGIFIVCGLYDAVFTLEGYSLLVGNSMAPQVFVWQYPDVFNSFSFCVCCYENKRICRPDDWLCRDCHGKCRTFKSRMGSVVSVDSHLFLGAG